MTLPGPPRPYGPPCICGHLESEHIYGEGACRPGFVCPCPEYHNAATAAAIPERGPMTETDPGNDAALAAEQEREACRLTLAAAKHRMELLDLEAQVLKRSEHIRIINEAHDEIVAWRKTLKSIPVADKHAEELRRIETPIYNTLAHLIEVQNADREKLERLRRVWERHCTGESIIGSGQAAHAERIAAEHAAAQVPA